MIRGLGRLTILIRGPRGPGEAASRPSAFLHVIFPLGRARAWQSHDAVVAGEIVPDLALDREESKDFCGAPRADFHDKLWSALGWTKEPLINE